jgi:Heparinase II/III-like protein/Heparinase II/III N-terminus
VIGKLRGRSATELRDRIVQFGWVLTERAGVMPRFAIPSAMSSIPATPWPSIDADAIAARIATDERRLLLEHAERIVSGRFDVLGREGLSYGTPVDWQRDPLTGRSAERVHWSRVPYLDAAVVGDHKVTWEVNRHQWFVTLGQAWVLTRDARYVDTAVALLRDWLDANPPKVGINWCSALELAFRVQSWLHGMRLIGDAAQFPASLRTDLLAAVAVHASHIERNLSRWFSPNTHLTGEALALLSVGCAWPTLGRAARWRSIGWEILCAELPKQVQPDGVYFEQSAWYQAYTVDFYVQAMAWAGWAKLPIPHDMRDRVRLAARALRAVTRPDGTIARLGDDDGGYTQRLTAAPFGDMTDTLWRAAAALDDPSLVPPINGARSSLLWLEGCAAFDRLAHWSPTQAGSSVALRDGGWFVLAEDGAASRPHWLIFDGGPHGSPPYGHSHADALAIDVSVHGVPLLVDPGTGAYVGEQRRWFRSTRAHNTVTVDGRDSSEQWTSFKWKSAARTLLEGFGVAREAQWVGASHDGYERLADPVRHHRILLRFDRRYWLMFDSLTAASRHDVTLTFQAAPGAAVSATPRGDIAISADGVCLRLALDPLLHVGIEDRAVSPLYELSLPACAVVGTAAIDCDTTFCSVFAAEDEAGAVQVARLPTRSSWRVTHAHGADVVACPRGTAVTFGSVTFDGSAFAVLGADAPHTVVAVGTGTLHLDRRQISLGPDSICVAHRAPDGTWTLES